MCCECLSPLSPAEYGKHCRSWYQERSQDDESTTCFDALIHKGCFTCVRYREIAGFEGVLAGCLVALKQIMPDNEVVLLKVIRFRVKVGCQSTGCYSFATAIQHASCLSPEQQLINLASLGLAEDKR